MPNLADSLKVFLANLKEENVSDLRLYMLKEINRFPAFEFATNPYAVDKAQGHHSYGYFVFDKNGYSVGFFSRDTEETQRFCQIFSVFRKMSFAELANSLHLSPGNLSRCDLLREALEKSPLFDGLEMVPYNQEEVPVQGAVFITKLAAHQYIIDNDKDPDDYKIYECGKLKSLPELESLVNLARFVDLNKL